MEESKSPLKLIKPSRNEARGATAPSSTSSRSLKEAPATQREGPGPKPATACRSKENITTAREDHKDQGSNRGTGRASTASPQDPGRGKPRRLTGRTSSGERGKVRLEGLQQQRGDARPSLVTGRSPAGVGVDRDTGATGMVATSSEEGLTLQTKTSPLKEKSPGELFYTLHNYRLMFEPLAAILCLC